MSDAAPTTASSMFTPLRDVAEHTAALGDQGVPVELPQEDNNTSSQPPPLSMVTGDVMALKSLCVSCEDEGTTNLLLTRIPFFRDVILMAFECEHCGYRSSELQSAEIQEKGSRFEVQVTSIEVRRRHFRVHELPDPSPHMTRHH